MLALSGVAHADNIDELTRKLAKSSDYKVRLSAALSLAKLRDQRSVSAFLGALSDSDKTVRGVAAASLGKIVDSSTSGSLRKKAVAALKDMANKDSNSFVRKQAQKAFETLKDLKSEPEIAAGSAGGTYVNIGAMSADVADADKIRGLMRKTVQKTFKKQAGKMMIEWPGAKDPNKQQISAKKVQAFHVDGTLNELTTSGSGSSTTVSCKVSMLLATYPEKSMFGFLKGGAKVQAGSSPKEVGFAQEDCVAAVIEDLIARKIIPTIESRAN